MLNLKKGDYVLTADNRRRKVLSVLDGVVDLSYPEGYQNWDTTHCYRKTIEELERQGYTLVPRPEPLTKYETTGDPLAQLLWELSDIEGDYKEASTNKSYWEHNANAIREYFRKGGK